MKKTILILLLLLLLISMVFCQATNNQAFTVSAESGEIIRINDQNNLSIDQLTQIFGAGKFIYRGIRGLGLLGFLRLNWGFMLVILSGLFWIVVVITPSKADDRFFNMFVKPVYNIGYNVLRRAPMAALNSFMELLGNIFNRKK